MKDFLVDIGSNRRLAAGILAGEFGKPWHFLAEMPLHARGSAARELDSSANSDWWCYFSIRANLFREELLTAPRLIFLGE